VAKQTQSTGAARNQPQPPATINRTERALAFMVGGVFIAAFACIIAMIVMWLVAPGASGTGVWPVVMAIPLIGMPIGLVLMIVLLAIAWTRRGRENRDGSR
jgi:uncharacterized membrane protein